MSPLRRNIYPDDVTPEQLQTGVILFTDDADDHFHCATDDLVAVMQRITQMQHKEHLIQMNQRNAPPNEHIVFTLSNGYTLRSGGQEYELGAYARICDENGKEVVYWSSEEWRDAAEEVVGAIFSAVLHPERCEDLKQHVGRESDNGDESAPPQREEDNEVLLASLCPDNCPGVEFDVRHWLREADEEAIVTLREMSYGENYLSDEVAQDMRDLDENVSAVMAYCEALGCGFTCTVPIQATEIWIRHHRPHLVDSPGTDTEA